MSESTGYALYDLLGLQLNELQRINDTLEFISNIIQQDKQRLLFIFWSVAAAITLIALCQIIVQA